MKSPHLYVLCSGNSSSSLSSQTPSSENEAFKRFDSSSSNSPRAIKDHSSPLEAHVMSLEVTM